MRVRCNRFVQVSVIAFFRIMFERCYNFRSFENRFGRFNSKTGVRDWLFVKSVHIFWSQTSIRIDSFALIDAMTLVRRNDSLCIDLESPMRFSLLRDLVGNWTNCCDVILYPVAPMLGAWESLTRAWRSNALDPWCDLVGGDVCVDAKVWICVCWNELGRQRSIVVETKLWFSISVVVRGTKPLLSQLLFWNFVISSTLLTRG